MISAVSLTNTLRECGFTTVSGVPDSLLTPLMNSIISDRRLRYLSVTQEGEAAAISAGAWLGGGLGAVVLQNSGVGNLVNPVTSLLEPSGIPALMIVGWRGQPGRPDEPQHALMGKVTHELLELIGVHTTTLSDQEGLLSSLAADMRNRRVRALVVPAGTFADADLHEGPIIPRHGAILAFDEHRDTPARLDALEAIVARLPTNAAVVSTTGKTSRELYELGDSEQFFYLVGAMGSAMSVGLGVALQVETPVVVIDGDGSLLMRLGAMASVGAHGGPNLIHIVLDNGVHDSTGGQLSLSGAVNMPSIARASSYAQVLACSSLHDLQNALSFALTVDGPTFIHMRIEPGSKKDLQRPKVGPYEVAQRFRDFCVRIQQSP